MDQSENGKKSESKQKRKSVKKGKLTHHNLVKEGINQFEQLCVQENKQEKGVKMPGNIIPPAEIKIKPGTHDEGDSVWFHAQGFEANEYYWKPIKGFITAIKDAQSEKMTFIVPEMPPMKDEVAFQVTMIKPNGETLTESASITLPNITFVGFVATIQVDTHIWFSLTHDNKGDEWVTKDGTRIWFVPKPEIDDIMNLLMISCDQKLPIRIRASFDSSLQKRTFEDTYAVKSARILRDDLHFNA